MYFKFIDEDKYRLSEDNYHSKVTTKEQIVFGHTMSSNMNHCNGWSTRLGGKTKKTATFTIDIKGRIYQHYDPKYYSTFVGQDNVDQKIISILIENEGWLAHNTEKNVFIDWVGNIYNRTDEIIEKRWRGQLYWAPYNEAQFESAIKLAKYLCAKFNIVQQCIPHNTKFDGVYEYRGIIYRSNFEKFFTDLSPAWDFNEFKNKIELN